MSPRAAWFWAGLSGLLLSLSFPNFIQTHFPQWSVWLALGALVPLLLSARGRSPGQAFALGYGAGLIFFLVGLVWVTNVKPMGSTSIPAWLALSAWCALFLAVFLAAYAWADRQGIPWMELWAPLAWTSLELGREHFLSGFPWIGLGWSQATNNTVLPMAAVLGVWGLHTLVAGVNVTLARAWQGRLRWRWSLALGSGLLIAWLVGRHSQAQILSVPPRVIAAVLQGDIDEDQAWNEAYRKRVMTTYVSLMEAAAKEGATVFVWPESSFPGFFNVDSRESRTLLELSRRRHWDLVIGSTLVTPKQQYMNAALHIYDGTWDSYGKRHLVPFGEFVPFRAQIPLLDRALERFGVSDFTPGSQAKIFKVQGIGVTPLVCYESVFPSLAFASEGSAPPDALAILTVDTWFGDSAAPYAHAAQAILRAVENGAWVLRSAATGVSMVIDPYGQVRGSLDLHQAGYLLARIDTSIARGTPFQHFGWIFVWLCIGLTLHPWFGMIWRAIKKAF